MFCRHCGSASGDDDKFCTHCGQALASTQFPTSASEQWNESDAINEYYATVIGPKNQHQYLHHFQNFDNTGKLEITWHWPAFFVTFWWMLYRKMWLYALLYFILPYAVLLVVAIVGAIMGDSGALLIGFGYLAFFVAMWVLPGLYGNAIYYRHCRSKIEATRSTHREIPRQLGELAAKGGTSNIALIIVLIFGMIAFIGILAAIAIPAYQDFTARAKMVEAYTAAKQASEAVTRYYERTENVPATLSEAGYVVTLPPATGTLSLNRENGALMVKLGFSPLRDKHLMLVPSLDENRRVVWKCSSKEIADKYLPGPCKKVTN